MDGQVTRREVLKAGLVGAAGLTVLPAVLAACNSSSATTAPAGGGPATGTLHIGNNRSDASDLKGIQAVNTAFTAANPGVNIVLNTVDHNTFQDQINNYLTTTPDDVCTWFSGFRMRFFASKSLISPIDDVWANVKSTFSAGFANAVTASDGHVYGIPCDYYPWAVFYRKSLFSDKGYTVPTTFADLLTLCAKMQSDGITPFAFADKDGWPAMGTFDILNLRTNGYDFHVGLLSGTNKWTDSKVTDVFNNWKKLIPYYTTGFSGLTWQQGCDTMVKKQAGMFLLGLFLTGEVDTVDTTGAAKADLDFFTFPYMGNAYDAEKSLDAPIDIIMMDAKSQNLTADTAAAKAYLAFWAKGSTQMLPYQSNNGFIPVPSDADVTKLDPLTQKAVQLVSAAQKITQFLDRDTRPDFAGANGMQSFLLDFLGNPSQDLAALQKKIQSFWDALPTFAG